ncbi:hypothetical protein M0R45_008881 [Rubus argutus]|uniref:Uncharacterized protein n=1 Tax=Rubus argutus TaxID=59490 RepID=A0AAW1Y308_RUBAR
MPARVDRRWACGDGGGSSLKEARLGQERALGTDEMRCLMNIVAGMEPFDATAQVKGGHAVEMKTMLDELGPVRRLRRYRLGRGVGVGSVLARPGELGTA